MLEGSSHHPWYYGELDRCAKVCAVSSVPAEEPVLGLPGVKERGQAGGAGGPQQQLDGVVVARQVHQQSQGLEGHCLVLPG